jgi:hypothetical protein
LLVVRLRLRLCASLLPALRAVRDGHTPTARHVRGLHGVRCLPVVRGVRA